MNSPEVEKHLRKRTANRLCRNEVEETKEMILLKIVGGGVDRPYARNWVAHWFCLNRLYLSNVPPLGVGVG